MTTIYITNSGMGAYLIDGVSNGTIALIRGNTYFLDINAYGHPFWIQTVPGGYTGYNIYTDGITNNGIESGTITFTFPVNTPSLLYYACQYHSSMQGMITISDAVTTTPITFDGFSRVFSLNGTFTISASSNSGGAFSYSTEDTDIITIENNTVTMKGVGTAMITATQAADGIYGANSTTANFTITNVTTAPITFNHIDKYFSLNGTFTISASSNSGGAFSYSTQNTNIITISGSTVTMKGVGSGTITATQAAYGIYGANSTTANFTIAEKITTNMTFIIPTRPYSTIPFTIQASSNRIGGIGTISYSTEDTDIITIENNTVTMLTVGTATITATLQESDQYTSGFVDATFTITKAPTSITFINFTRFFSLNGTFTIPASSNRSGTISYSTEDTDIITIENNTVTMLKLGTATIRATLPETDQYTSGSVEAIVSIIQNRVRISMISLYTNNAQVYYKPHSLAPCGVGSTRNYRIKSRKT